MRLRVHYFRYDQAYDGWDLWLWPKGHEGGAYPFEGSMPLPEHPESLMRYADVTLPDLPVSEVGLIIRHEGWNSRDWDSDRYVNLVMFPPNRRVNLYVVQNTEQILLHPDRISFIPTAERAIFRSYREIYIQLQAPCEDAATEPFMVIGNGIPRRIDRTEQLGNARTWLLTLHEDWVTGETCTVFKKGFESFDVQYGSLYDTAEFERLYAYDGDDLGCRPTGTETRFRIWAPTAARIEANLFRGSSDSFAERVLPMEPDRNGTWVLQVPEDLSGWYYTYNVYTGGGLQEVCDPNAVGLGINGTRALVARPGDSNPPGWDEAAHILPAHPTDAIFYEVHIRDFTIHPDSGAVNKGLFLGLAELGTKTPDGTLTGLSHLVELGVTHVHLMPIFDFFTIDESRQHQGQFNWGYDPHLYNAPEGSYTTNPADGPGRIRELKEMILALKRQGIGVIMDVVYNHTYHSLDSEFNKLVPGYFYRTDAAGNFSNGSGCGNETASERYMVRKTIIDSVLYWAREYRIDGFRFDLMALHDIDTMNGIRRALDDYHPGLLLYGEGWTGGASMLDPARAAHKGNAVRLLRVGFFNDNTRDAIKGDSFLAESGGFINGQAFRREGVKYGIVGAIPHPQVDAFRATGAGAWAGYPWHCVNYAASHDNLTLYDKLVATGSAASELDAVRRTNLAGVLVLLSQGIPFTLSGTEFLRTKQGMHNSYNMPDAINQIDWNRKTRFRASFDYHAGLIRLRKAHPAFRMISPEEIRMNLQFLNTPEHIVAWLLRNHANGDTWQEILGACNTGSDSETIRLNTAADWHVVVDDRTAGTETLATISGDAITLPPTGALVAWRA